MKRKKIPLLTVIRLVPFLLLAMAGFAQKDHSNDDPYSNMPVIAPIGERIAAYLAVNESSKGPFIDPKKGVSPAATGYRFKYDHR